MSRYLISENAVRKLRNVINATGVGNSAGPSAAAVDEQEYCPAFRVQWSSSVESWIIWIPSASVVTTAGVDVSSLVVSGLAAAGGIYPSGWYKIGISASSDWSTVYLNISDDSASFGTSASVGSTSVPIARIKGTDTPSFMRDVMQLQIGELVIGTGSSSPDNRSTGNNSASKLEVYGWKSQANADTSVADALSSDVVSDAAVVVRKGGPNGTLSYLPIGTLSRGGTGTVSVVADIRYNSTDHRLEKRVDTINLATGAVIQGNYEMIENGQTVAISNVIAPED